VDPRQVQYLRERGIVVPSIQGRGRGRCSYYGAEDVLRVHVALNVLDFVVLERRGPVVDEVVSRWGEEVTIQVCDGVSLDLDGKELRRQFEGLR
jgi:hypothetical protein